MGLPKVVRFGGFLLVLCITLDQPGFRHSVSVFYEGLRDATSSILFAREKRATATNVTEHDVQLVVTFPDLESFQRILSNISLPILINDTVEINSIETTTVCSPNITGYHCLCEENFAWSFNKCITYGVCEAIVGDTCGCINSLPADGQYCQPNSSQTATTTTTPSSTQAKVDSDVEIVVLIPTSAAPSSLFSYFRSYLQYISFPLTVSQSLEVKQVSFTTACDPYSANGLQCQCENGFAWPCDTCNSSNSCSYESCTCLYGLPPNDEFCQPITNVTKCKPTPTPSTAATPTTNRAAPNTTVAPTTTTTTPQPEANAVDIGVTLVFRIPSSSVDNIALSFLRSELAGLIFSITLPTSVKVKEINLTTVCTPNTAKELRCQCEDSFAWPCDLCNSSTSCNDVSSQYCTCRDRLSDINQYCQPLLNNAPCSVISTAMPTTTTTAVATPKTAAPNSTVVSTPAAPTAAVATPAPAAPKSIVGKITMDMPFSNSFNDKNNIVYKNIYKATEDECRKYASPDCTVRTLNFSEGSTIADYDLTVPATTPTQVKLTQDGILTNVASQYPVSIRSEALLSTDPNLFYVGDKLTVTCSPPTYVGEKVTVMWTHNGSLISTQNSLSAGNSTYTVASFQIYDDGSYICKVTWGANSTFTQSATLRSKPAPVVTVDPLKATLRCSDTKALTCSVNSGFAVTLLSPNGQDLGIQQYTYTAPSGCSEGQKVLYTCVSQPKKREKVITLVLTTKARFDCSDSIYGDAVVGGVAVGKCEPNKEGEKTAVCQADGTYGDKQDNCVLKVIADLFDRSQFLNERTIPVFLEDLKNVTVKNNQDIIESPATIVVMVKIFENVASKSTSLNLNISKDSTKNFLESAGRLTIDDSRPSWTFINYNNTRNTTENGLLRNSSSSSFLNVFERLTTFIGNDSLDVSTDFILLNKTKLTDPFNSEFNSSVAIEVLEGAGKDKFITIIIFASMYNVLPGRDKVNTSSNGVHGRVALVRPEVDISNISLTFDVINYTNDTLGNPKCVFWDFNLYNGLGGWSDDGCSLVYFENETVSCNCNHTTSFSILMSPDSPRSLILDYITYIGVGISMACLVICLIIEAIIWRKVNKNATSYLRHVSIVNIAVSLLIADIWFIIGAAISDADKKTPPACTAATFFIHFFYLALFFWMLASALLLFYRTVSVFDGGLSKISMLIIGFSLGYGAPLIIATITIAATAPSNTYIRENVVCWLNWYESKALLAFVIPALMIVVINFIILIVVLYKILRRRVGGNAAQAGEKHVLYVIARSLAVLTPFFGLTWGLGIGTLVDPTNFGIHVAFAFFNSLQGFFILVFGTLLDKKVWSAMNIKSLMSQGRTQSTSGGTSSGGLSNLFQRMRRNRGSRRGYHVSSTGQRRSGGSDSLNT